MQIDIPKEYIGKEIEITYLPLEEVNKNRSSGPSKTMKEFWGVISHKTAENIHKHISKSREEWERDI